MVMSAASELNLEGAGFTELQIGNENADYTVNLFASEAGDLFGEWAEVFTVRITDLLLAAAHSRTRGARVQRVLAFSSGCKAFPVPSSNG